MNSGTFAFCCGGTGGHIYPALALAQQLSSNHSCFFIGSKNRKDSVIVPKYNFPFLALVHSKPSFFSIFFDISKVYRYFKKNRPIALISTGGGQTLAVVLAAYFSKIPVFLLEQNTIAGRANRVLQYLAKKTYISYPESTRYFRYAIELGNPVRQVFIDDPMSEALASFHKKGPVIGVFGGSQGAHAINRLFIDSQGNRTEFPYSVIHIVGESFFKKYFKSSDPVILKSGKHHSLILPYCERMDLFYKLCDIVICRSGATSLAELAHFSKKALLIPYPYAKDNHQLYNALSFLNRFPGVLLQETQLNSETVLKTIESLLQTPEAPKQNNSAAFQIVTDIKKTLNTLQ